MIKELRHKNLFLYCLMSALLIIVVVHFDIFVFVTNRSSLLVLDLLQFLKCCRLLVTRLFLSQLVVVSDMSQLRMLYLQILSFTEHCRFLDHNSYFFTIPPLFVISLIGGFLCCFVIISYCYRSKPLAISRIALIK